MMFIGLNRVNTFPNFKVLTPVCIYLYVLDPSPDFCDKVN